MGNCTKNTTLEPLWTATRKDYRKGELKLKTAGSETTNKVGEEEGHLIRESWKGRIARHSLDRAIHRHKAEQGDPTRRRKHLITLKPKFEAQRVAREAAVASALLHRGVNNNDDRWEAAGMKKKGGALPGTKEERDRQEAARLASPRSALETSGGVAAANFADRPLTRFDESRSGKTHYEKQKELLARGHNEAMPKIDEHNPRRTHMGKPARYERTPPENTEIIEDYIAKTSQTYQTSN